VTTSSNWEWQGVAFFGCYQRPWVMPLYKSSELSLTGFLLQIDYCNTGAAFHLVKQMGEPIRKRLLLINDCVAALHNDLPLISFQSLLFLSSRKQETQIRIVKKSSF
jgi:hypothetical protein